MIRQYRVIIASGALILTLFLAACGGKGPETKAEPAFRPAVAADCVGIWKQVAVESQDPEMDLSDPWFSGHQFYWFQEFVDDKQMLKIIIREGEEASLEELMPIWEPTPWKVFLLWGTDGQTVFNFPDQNRKNPVLITFCTKDIDTGQAKQGTIETLGDKLPRAGDLSLTFVDSEFKPVYYKLLRKVQ